MRMDADIHAADCAEAWFNKKKVGRRGEPENQIRAASHMRPRVVPDSDD